MTVEAQPLTKLSVHIHYYQNKAVVGHDVLEGEVPMSAHQQDAYKQLLGDQKAEVVVSKELSEADYGNGGKVFVSVKLTVDQSQPGLESGFAWAKMFADKYAWEAHEEMRQQLHQRGILK
jgi:hypothetical protein